MDKKYSLEIDISGYETDKTTRYGGWLGLGTLTTEGNDLEECMDNAQYDLIDQDGGTYNIVEGDPTDWMRILIAEAYQKQMLEVRKNG